MERLSLGIWIRAQRICENDVDGEMEEDERGTGRKMPTRQRRSGMKKEMLMLAMVAQFFYAGHVIAADEPSEGHREVSGTIEKVESDLISVKTEEGTTRTFTVTEGKRENARSFKPGDKVVLEMDEGNQIVDIHREGAIITEGDHRHRSISGTLKMFSRTDKKIIIEANDGGTESFLVKDSAASKLGSIREGTQVTLEIDEQNRVMDVHGG